MTYVITEPCIGTKDASCVEVCPVDCIYEGEDQYYIHPDECIDCGACEPECPVTAIFPDSDVPPEWTSYIEAMDCGCVDYLSKPVDVDQIIAAYAGAGQAAPAGARPRVPSLGRVEWEHIQRVLTDCGGNVSQAAKLLGLHRRSLQRKLSKYPPRD